MRSEKIASLSSQMLYMGGGLRPARVPAMVEPRYFESLMLVGPPHCHGTNASRVYHLQSVPGWL